MRQNLARFERQIITVRGRFGRYGFRRDALDQYVYENVVVQSVYLLYGGWLCDHVWLRHVADVCHALNLKQGDWIRFRARVWPYDRQGVTEYGLFQVEGLQRWYGGEAEPSSAIEKSSSTESSSILK